MRWHSKQEVIPMKVLNFGSLNLDYTYQVPHIVAPGETLTSLGLAIHPGGKGLNQSVALAKAGAETYHAGQIGQDGGMLCEVCKDSGADIRFIRTVETRTGNAIIQVDQDGQNCILLYPGANRCMERSFVNEVLSFFEAGDYLLLQNEINELSYIIDSAYAKEMKIILNPSPMDEQVLGCDLSKISMFILNEVEAGQLTGEKDPDKILSGMRAKFPEAEIVLTLGGDGSVYAGKGSDPEAKVIPQKIYPCHAIDTTGAGDTYTGYFIAEYLKEQDPVKALDIASMAASIAVSREGAASAIPEREEVLRCLAQSK